jgi:hypothetical protein
VGETLDLALIHRWCEQHPGLDAALPTEDLLALLDEREDFRRRLKALEEHLLRRHGCKADCWGEGCG